jgi:hypothetical protein
LRMLFAWIMINLEPFTDALRMALVGDTEIEGIKYLQSREIPYRIIMRNGKLQTPRTAVYNNTRLNLIVVADWITQVSIG